MPRFVQPQPQVRLKQFLRQYIGTKEETKMVVMEIEMVTGKESHVSVIEVDDQRSKVQK